MNAPRNTAAPAPPIVAMRGVAVSALLHSAHIVLEGVNWTVTPGDYWVLAGWHRSGKSDLLALAAGMSQPEKGEFRLFGVDLAEASEADELAARKRLGVSFPGGRLLHQLTVAENIALPLCYHRDWSLEGAADEVNRLLEIIGLEKQAGLMPSDLGRNLLRRAGLARALVLRPEWLVLDDPLSGLDFREARWWLDFLELLAAGHPWMNRQPLTIAATTDDLRPWAGRARQFAVLKDRGFHVCGGPPRSGGAAEPLLQEFMEETPRQADGIAPAETH